MTEQQDEWVPPMQEDPYDPTPDFPHPPHGDYGPPRSAQVAELMVLIRACHLFRDQVVTIYADSRYAFGVTHDF
ncbi:hypothetical protein P4O66_019197, partial [Electrophorus voltai]